MTYAEQLAPIAAAADAEVSGLTSQLAEAKSQLQSALDAAQSATTENEQLTVQVAADATLIAKLRAKIAALQAQLHPVAPVLFSCQHRAEADFQAANVRTGGKLGFHRHYLNKWTDVAAAAKACTAPVFCFTVGEQNPLPADVAATWPDLPTIAGHIHEPEVKLDPALFRSLQVQDRLSIDSANASRTNKVHFGGCLMGWTYDKSSGRNPDDWWPGDGVWDHLGSDNYPNSFVDMATEWDFVPYAKAKGIQCAVFEWGIEPVADRETYIRENSQFAKDNGFLCLNYWDKGGDILLTDAEYLAVVLG